LLIGGSALFAQKSVYQSGIKISTVPLHGDVPADGYQADLIAIFACASTQKKYTKMGYCHF
jgi:hypothetical protein